MLNFRPAVAIGYDLHVAIVTTAHLPVNASGRGSLAADPLYGNDSIFYSAETAARQQLDPQRTQSDDSEILDIVAKIRDNDILRFRVLNYFLDHSLLHAIMFSPLRALLLSTSSTTIICYRWIVNLN